MVSALHYSETIVEALNFGANDYVTKPIDFPVAIARIQTQLSRKRAEEALRESEERYALAMHGAKDGLWDWDLRTQTIYFSPRWKTMLGFNDHDLPNSCESWFSRVHPEDRKQLDFTLQAHFAGQTAHFEHEHRVMHHDGTYRWVLSRGLAIRDNAGHVTRMAGSQTDITERKVADGLTGLPNRIWFTEHLGQTLARLHHHKDAMFAVLLLDLDRFKVINDSLGHSAGDELLIALSRRLETSMTGAQQLVQLHVTPTVARLGGDEFIILVDAIHHVSDATAVAEYVQQQLSAPFMIGEHEVFTTASMGIALSATGYTRPEDMVRDAETAMYRAKTHGKACHEVFDTPMYRRALALMQMENDLRRAVERQEFRVFYQPIVCLRSGRMAGFEALLRWYHPQRGLLSPTEFIPLAEETGLIIPMGSWVLRVACQQLARWQQQFVMPHPLSVSVNLSGKQLMQDGLIDHVEEVLEETGLAAHTVKLEITESVLIEQSRPVTQMIDRLHALGVQLSLDDFGTGYASLSYLYHLPLHILKIDRSFISRMNTERKQAEIVRTIMVLAHNLGLDVVAEGVETPEHLAALRALHGQYGQGYLFAEPLNAQDATSLLTAAPQW
jgi:diguanylate cyclase (GGDEF)-like protein/PAS domain S-box-containing protein